MTVASARRRVGSGALRHGRFHQNGALSVLTDRPLKRMLWVRPEAVMGKSNAANVVDLEAFRRQRDARAAASVAHAHARGVAEGPALQAASGSNEGFGYPVATSSWAPVVPVWFCWVPVWAPVTP